MTHSRLRTQLRSSMRWLALIGVTASGCVEFAVTQRIRKRKVKTQQLQWTKRGAHLLAQMRAQVLTDDLDHTFGGWSPGFRAKEGARKAA